MDFDLGQLIVWVIIGALAGFLAGRLFRRRGFGLVGDVVIGLLGAIIGGALFQFLNIHILENVVLRFSLTDLIAAIVGALLLMLVFSFLQRRR